MKFEQHDCYSRLQVKHLAGYRCTLWTRTSRRSCHKRAAPSSWTWAPSWVQGTSTSTSPGARRPSSRFGTILKVGHGGEIKRSQISHIFMYGMKKILGKRGGREGGRKKGNILFNDILNTFYWQLYEVGHMVKDHSDSERGNPVLPHGLLFPISSKGSFIGTMPQTG